MPFLRSFVDATLNCPLPFALLLAAAQATPPSHKSDDAETRAEAPSTSERKHQLDAAALQHCRCCADPGYLAEQLIAELGWFDVGNGGRNVKAVHHQLEGASGEIVLQAHAASRSMHERITRSVHLEQYAFVERIHELCRIISERPAGLHTSADNGSMINTGYRDVVRRRRGHLLGVYRLSEVGLDCDKGPRRVPDQSAQIPLPQPWTVPPILRDTTYQ